jgi:hypothetical protein
MGVSYSRVLPVLCISAASRFMDYFCEELCFEIFYGRFCET